MNFDDQLQLVKISKSNLLQNPPILFVVMMMDWPVHLKHQELLPKGVHIKQTCQAFFCLPRKSPIKIGSPVRVIKKNGSIAGIEPIPKATHKPKKSFQGNEISNHKVRDGGISPSSGSEHQQHNPSMVSVPSQYTDATSTDPDENKDVQHKPREKQKQKHHHRHHHHKQN